MSPTLFSRGSLYLEGKLGFNALVYYIQVKSHKKLGCDALDCIGSKSSIVNTLILHPKKKKVNTLILTQSLGVGSNALDLITCHNDDILILLATYLMPTQSFSNHDNKFALLALLLKWHEPTQHEFVTWITVSL